MVVCLERGADLLVAQLMPLPLTVSCFSKIEIGFTSLLPAYPGSPGKRAAKRVCVCVCVRLFTLQFANWPCLSVFIDHASLVTQVRQSNQSNPLTVCPAMTFDPETKGSPWCIDLVIFERDSN